MYDHNVTQSEFEKVIDFLRSTQVPPEFFRSNLLLMLEKHFDYSVSSLWLVGSHSLYDPISYNVDRRIIRSYQDYYYKFDPFHPIYMKNRRLMEKPVLTMDDIALTDYPSKDMSSNPYFSYLSDEYSLTQDIILSFNVGRQQYGSAALFTKHSNDANRMLFINCLNIITPFIAQMLCQSLQMLDLKFKTETLESVVCSMDDGIIMFDGTGSVLYYNTQLLRFCQDITGGIYPPTHCASLHVHFCRWPAAPETVLSCPSFRKATAPSLFIRRSRAGMCTPCVYRRGRRKPAPRSPCRLPSRRVSVRSYLSYLRARRTARSPLCCISRCRQSKRTYQISFRKPESATALLC